MLYPVQPGPLQPKWCRFPDLLLHTHRDVTGASDTVSTRRAIVRGELGCRKKTLGRTQKSVVLEPQRPESVTCRPLNPRPHFWPSRAIIDA